MGSENGAPNHQNHAPRVQGARYTSATFILGSYRKSYYVHKEGVHTKPPRVSISWYFQANSRIYRERHT